MAQLTKNFEKGFPASIAYTYGDSYSINDGTSSQNNSQWAGNRGISGRNEEGELGRSVYAIGNRVVAQLSYRKEYLGFAASQIPLFYNGQSGQPFSYVVGGETFSRQLVNDGISFPTIILGVIEFAGFQAVTRTPNYTVNSKILEGQEPWDNNIIDSGFRSSRWQMQIGARYIFGN